jgi:hypothetical protein
MIKVSGNFRNYVPYCYEKQQKGTNFEIDQAEENNYAGKTQAGAREGKLESRRLWN